VGHIRLITGLLLAVCAWGADTPLDKLLDSVEARYNKAKTLQVLFKEVYAPPGKMKRQESGILMLKKQGKMRWQYSQPAGKLLVSDGKWLWLDTPDEKRVEKMKFKETDDLRAPLAFLLGKLNFDKEFQNLKGQPEAGGMRVTGEAKSENLPYSSVEFLVAPDATIREVKVTGYDKSIIHFTFDQERLDPPLDAKLFNYHAPKGYEVVEVGQ
jgi:outer membrane lipoprotein carrier protein